MKQFIKKIFKRNLKENKRFRTSIQKILKENQLIAYDIGAAVGLPTHWEKFQEHIFFIAIEPDKKECANLESKYRNIKYKVFDIALDENGGEKILYLLAARTGSSLLKIKESNPYVSNSYIYPIEEIKISTITLNDLITKNSLQNPSLLKIDTQGTELQILRGASSKMLEDCLAIEIEVGMPGGYQNQASFPEINDFMKENNFELFDCRVARGYLKESGEIQNYFSEIFGVCNDSPTIAAKIWEFDCIYLKSMEYVFNRKSSELLRKYVLILCVYNFFIEAYHVTKKAAKDGIIKEIEEKEILSSIKNIHKEKEYFPIYGNKIPMGIFRNILKRVSLRSSKRWYGHTYQEFPN